MFNVGINWKNHKWEKCFYSNRRKIIFMGWWNLLWLRKFKIFEEFKRLYDIFNVRKPCVRIFHCQMRNFFLNGTEKIVKHCFRARARVRIFFFFRKIKTIHIFLQKEVIYQDLIWFYDKIIEISICFMCTSFVIIGQPTNTWKNFETRASLMYFVIVG